MSAHFPGSASVAGRRRRRLAHDAQAEHSPLATTRASKSTRAAEVELSPEPPVSTRWKWLRFTLIPRRWGLIAVFTCMTLAAWAGMLWLGLSNWSTERGLREFTTLNNGPVVRFFSVLQLLMTAQLSFLIYWYRSRSRKDFMGRYRIWGWTGLFWSVVCLVKATHINTSSIESVLERLQLDSWRPETVAWLFPLSIGVVAIYRILRREVRQSRTSLIAWELSFGLGVLTAGLAIGGENFLPEALRLPVFVGMSTLWQASLTISSLIHARYVVHVSSEAAPRQPSRGTKVLRWTNRGINAVGERVLSTRVPKFRKRSNLESAAAGDDTKPKRTRRSSLKSEAVQPSTPKPQSDSGRDKKAAAQTTDSETPKKASRFSFFGKGTAPAETAAEEKITKKPAAATVATVAAAVATDAKPAAKSRWLFGSGLLKSSKKDITDGNLAAEKVRKKEVDKKPALEPGKGPTPSSPDAKTKTARATAEAEQPPKSRWSLTGRWQKSATPDAAETKAVEKPTSKPVAEVNSAQKSATPERRGPEPKKPVAMPPVAGAEPKNETKSGWSFGSRWLKKSKDDGQALRVDEAKPQKAAPVTGPHSTKPTPPPAKPVAAPAMVARPAVPQSPPAKTPPTSAVPQSKPIQREIPKSDTRPTPDARRNSDPDDDDEDDDEGMSRRDRKKQKKMQRQQSRDR